MKRLAALFVSLLIVLSCTAAFAVGGVHAPPAFTEEERAAFLEAVGVEEPEINPDQFDCSMCHVGTFGEDRFYTQWYINGNTRDCPNDWTAKDHEEERTATHAYVCNNCGFGYTATSTETRWICNH